MTLINRYRTHLVLVVFIALIAGLAVFFLRQASPAGSEIIIRQPPSELQVYIEGEINFPGLYILEEGSRIEALVEAAGGFTPAADVTSVNLAAVLRDGYHVHVYSAGESPQKVNINTAEAWLLEALPGVGEVLAQRIVSYREQNGPFLDLEDLTMVEGIGQSLFQKIEDKITVH